jgi:hypothetical protein
MTYACTDTCRYLNDKRQNAAALCKHCLGAIMNDVREKDSFAESLCSWIVGQDKTDAGMSSVERTMHVRRKIIETLEHGGLSEDSPLMFKIVNTPGLSGLWYLRPEIAQALSSMHGEDLAQTIMRDITSQFAGKLPQSMFGRVRMATSAKPIPKIARSAQIIPQ